MPYYSQINHPKSYPVPCNPLSQYSCNGRYSIISPESKQQELWSGCWKKKIENNNRKSATTATTSINKTLSYHLEWSWVNTVNATNQTTTLTMILGKIIVVHCNVKCLQVTGHLAKLQPAEDNLHFCSIVCFRFWAWKLSLSSLNFIVFCTRLCGC